MTTQPAVRIAVAIVTLAACLSSALADPLPAGKAQSSSPDQAEPTAPNNLPQVTIKAQRLSLELRVHAFVSHITTSLVGDNDSLTRWHFPICPLVAGLPAEQGEAVLTRLSQIAAAAGASLGPRRCEPNFHVVVTSDPEGLLKKWRARNPFIFGPVPPLNGEVPITRFLHTNRPVRVWYNTEFTSAEGGASSDGQFEMSGVDLGGAQTVKIWGASRVKWPVVLNLTSVIIVVDTRHTKGYTLGQLADYIGMIGLTELNLDSDLESAPTILRLFAASSSGEGRPDGLSSWDQAFLKGLYNTDQSSRWQRSRIVTRVVQDILP
jgi:hypothetical protein